MTPGAGVKGRWQWALERALGLTGPGPSDDLTTEAVETACSQGLMCCVSVPRGTCMARGTCRRTRVSCGSNVSLEGLKATRKNDSENDSENWEKDSEEDSEKGSEEAGLEAGA